MCQLLLLTATALSGGGATALDPVSILLYDGDETAAVMSCEFAVREMGAFDAMFWTWQWSSDGGRTRLQLLTDERSRLRWMEQFLKHKMEASRPSVPVEWNRAEAAMHLSEMLLERLWLGLVCVDADLWDGLGIPVCP
ncbi:hypothetical protein PpBr36_08898 [Pyricularia pennisetigena]|uniref:hypothetical protein n=1 Tax=Pyricularia pennisetigena TaxID=1578925 RepID=UPI001153FB2B|nr:hypothetical protein PpBr36_08898 [Pyricularia pennisetigena]TLS23975.1 hypothetical protein PpBr36_08898 [Pyricularia pennisetigena]